MSLTSRTSLLLFLAQLQPGMSDAVIPDRPGISLAIRHMMAASILQSISPEVKDTGISKALNNAGRTLFDAAVRYMNYDKDAWYFETVPPGSWYPGIEETMLNPQPLPPREQSYYGVLLMLLSNAISMEHLKDILFSAGESLKKPLRPVTAPSHTPF